MEATPTLADRADPMPAAALGMWLFLAGEAMFFAGLLTAYIALQSVPGERALFLRSARVVSLPLTIVAGVLLAATVIVWWRGVTTVRRQAVAAGLAVAFLLVQMEAWAQLLSHKTIVTATTVYDGSVSEDRGKTMVYGGSRMSLAQAFDVHVATPDNIRGDLGRWESFDAADIRVAANYGPSRNNYFACYFLVGIAHALHVIGGLAALVWLIGRTRKGMATAAQARIVTLYWQFVNSVGLLSLVLLSLG